MRGYVPDQKFPHNTFPSNRSDLACGGKTCGSAVAVSHCSTGRNVSVVEVVVRALSVLVMLIYLEDSA